MNPEENQNELDKFLGDLKSESPQLEQEQPKEEVPQEEEQKESEEEPKLNRQQRRAIENAGIRKQLQEEREARIAAEARAEALRGITKDTEIDERLVRLYGDTENGKLAAQLHAQMLADVEQRAMEKAYERIKQEREAETQEISQEEQFIDEQLAYLEDETGVDLTSNTAQARKARAEFLEVVEKLSPKDNDGNIVEFADFGSAFEMFQASRRSPTNPRAREIASRGIEKSGAPNASQQAKEEQDSTRSWLRSVGIKV